MEVSELMKMSTKRRKVALNWQTTKSKGSSAWRIISHVKAYRKKDIG